IESASTLNIVNNISILEDNSVCTGLTDSVSITAGKLVAKTGTITGGSVTITGDPNYVGQHTAEIGTTITADSRNILIDLWEDVEFLVSGVLDAPEGDCQFSNISNILNINGSIQAKERFYVDSSETVNVYSCPLFYNTGGVRKMEISCVYLNLGGGPDGECGGVDGAGTNIYTAVLEATESLMLLDRWTFEDTVTIVDTEAIGGSANTLLTSGAAFTIEHSDTNTTVNVTLDITSDTTYTTSIAGEFLVSDANQICSDEMLISANIATIASGGNLYTDDVMTFDITGVGSVISGIIDSAEKVVVTTNSAATLTFASSLDFSGDVEIYRIADVSIEAMLSLLPGKYISVEADSITLLDDSSVVSADTQTYTVYSAFNANDQTQLEGDVITINGKSGNSASPCVCTLAGTFNIENELTIDVNEFEFEDTASISGIDGTTTILVGNTGTTTLNGSFALGGDYVYSGNGTVVHTETCALVSPVSTVTITSADEVRFSSAKCSANDINITSAAFNTDGTAVVSALGILSITAQASVIDSEGGVVGESELIFEDGGVENSSVTFDKAVDNGSGDVMFDVDRVVFNATFTTGGTITYMNVKAIEGNSEVNGGSIVLIDTTNSEMIVSSPFKANQDITIENAGSLEINSTITCSGTCSFTAQVVEIYTTIDCGTMIVEATQAMKSIISGQLDIDNLVQITANTGDAGVEFALETVTNGKLVLATTSAFFYRDTSWALGIDITATTIYINSNLKTEGILNIYEIGSIQNCITSTDWATVDSPVEMFADEGINIENSSTRRIEISNFPVLFKGNIAITSEEISIGSTSTVSKDTVFTAVNPRENDYDLYGVTLDARAIQLDFTTITGSYIVIHGMDVSLIDTELNTKGRGAKELEGDGAPLNSEATVEDPRVGASHGGEGGYESYIDDIYHWPEMTPYGNPFYPITSGSGGIDAFGGGFVQIIIQNFSAKSDDDEDIFQFYSEGTCLIDCSAEEPDDMPLGGGSGGSILIDATRVDEENGANFQGFGQSSLLARGSDATIGNGGGGRIALVGVGDKIVVSHISKITLMVSVIAGEGDEHSGEACPGTFYFEKSKILYVGMCQQRVSLGTFPGTTVPDNTSFMNFDGVVRSGLFYIIGKAYSNFTFFELPCNRDCTLFVADNDFTNIPAEFPEEWRLMPEKSFAVKEGLGITIS
ncbi:hypothetical protein ADUPG1_013332, partial [Aduncisulcus paluster]